MAGIESLKRRATSRDPRDVIRERTARFFEEDRLDAADADRVLDAAKPEDFIPWEKVKVGMAATGPASRKGYSSGKKEALGRMNGTGWIDDPDLFKAVSFARVMMRRGTPPGLANHKAARYYGVSTSDVAHHTGRVGAEKSIRMRSR